MDYPLDELRRFWPDKEAILYDALRYLSQQIDVWRRQLMLDRNANRRTKVAGTLSGVISALKQPLSGLSVYRCLYVLSRSRHPIHQLADQQKSAAYDFTHELLTTLEVDDPAMVAKQMELVLEGCLSRMLVNRSPGGCRHRTSAGGRYPALRPLPSGWCTDLTETQKKRFAAILSS